MLTFNELRVAPDGKHLIIDVQVQDFPYYEDVYVDTIIVDTQKTYSDTGPSNKPLFTFEGVHTKHYRNYIDIDGIPLSMFFVYVLSTGTPAPDTPCGMGQTSIVGIAYNKEPIYQYSIKMLNSIGGCEPSGELIDYILRQKAFDLALDTGNFSKAIEYWNLFLEESEQVVGSNCGCYGRFRWTDIIGH